MRLLIITQKVDRNDPVLGFMHRWLIEFSKQFDYVRVICLEEGEHELPNNVSVFSLGKEERQSRLQYLIHFYWYVLHEHKKYDAVFVHMNQEYVLLAGVLWKMMGKKVTMWRNHYAGSFLTDVAASLCDAVFCTSKHSYTAKYKKTIFMPVGVDADFFKAVPGLTRRPRSILSLGRISPSKRLGILVDASVDLHKKGIEFTLDVYGNPAKNDESYLRELEQKAKDGNATSVIKFYPGISNEQTPQIYSAHSIFVNLSPAGMYDKTIFEALACGCLDIVANKDLPADLGDEYFYSGDDPIALAAKLERLLRMNEKEREAAVRVMREKVLDKHTLSLLASTLYTVLHE